MIHVVYRFAKRSTHEQLFVFVTDSASFGGIIEQSGTLHPHSAFNRGSLNPAIAADVLATCAVARAVNFSDRDTTISASRAVTAFLRFARLLAVLVMYLQHDDLPSVVLYLPVGGYIALNLNLGVGCHSMANN